MCQNRWESSSDSTSVQVSWGRVPPEMANGIITAYYVELTPYNGSETMASDVQSNISNTSLSLTGLTLSEWTFCDDISKFTRLSILSTCSS